MCPYLLARILARFIRGNCMQKNVGNVDRGIRGLVGVLLMMIFFVAPPANVYLYWGCLVVGLMMLATAALSWCPPYAIFGIKTCKDKGDAGES